MGFKLGSRVFLATATLLALSACKVKVNELQFVAAPGTRVEYRLLPDGPAGEITVAGEKNKEGLAAQTLPMNVEAEALSLVIRHEKKAEIGSPDLRVTLTPDATASQSGFTAGGVETELRLRSRENEPNGYEKVNCKNLVEASGASGKIKVILAAPASPGDCNDRALRLNDPLWSGRSRDVGKGLNYYSESDDARMGQEFVANFNSKNGAFIVHDHAGLPYLQNMMDRIAAVSDAPHIRPRVHLINANVVNAFALPGGDVYVFRGIMESVRDESELVGILGHEWAHVTARHGTKNVSRAINGQVAVFSAALAIELGIDLWLNRNNKDVDKNSDDEEKKKAERRALVGNLAKQAATAVVSVANQLVLLGYSREAEAEADTLGAQYAYRAGYAPDGIGRFFNGLAAGHSEKIFLEEMLSSHPEHTARVSLNAQNIGRYFPGDAYQRPTMTPTFKEVVAHMRTNLPPMLQGADANKMLALQFIESEKQVTRQEVESYFRTEGR